MFIVKDQGLVGLILDEVKPPRIKLLSLSQVLTESIHPSHHHSQLFFEWYGKIKTFLLDFALFKRYLQFCSQVHMFLLNIYVCLSDLHMILISFMSHLDNSHFDPTSN